jgi:glycosyltransferase involved in cell wall biosynthesis
MRSFPGRGIALRAWRAADIAAARALAPLRRADISLFHIFEPPPNGGGHQFLRALMREFAVRGWRVENNTISGATRVCLFNSFNFDADRLRRLARAGCRMVHRVDGPLAAYRGFDDGTDRRIWEFNREFAHATILQSEYSRRQHEAMGLAYSDAVTILNAADPALFAPAPREPLAGRRARLVSTSWSDNRNKGADVYAWLDEHLDWSRYEYTFIGRLPLAPRHIRVEPPSDSRRVAALLRRADIFITASRNDPCSNSLIEALTCGLPAIYLNSGGHPEIVGTGGLAFNRAEEIPDLLDRMMSDYSAFASRVRAPRIADVADAYLRVMGLPSRPGGEAPHA